MKKEYMNGFHGLPMAAKSNPKKSRDKAREQPRNFRGSGLAAIVLLGQAPPSPPAVAPKAFGVKAGCSQSQSVAVILRKASPVAKAALAD